MPKQKQKIEYTPEEKIEFVTNNLKVMFWAEKDLVLEFDKLAKAKGYNRKDAMLALMRKFIAKQKKVGKTK